MRTRQGQPVVGEGTSCIRCLEPVCCVCLRNRLRRFSSSVHSLVRDCKYKISLFNFKVWNQCMHTHTQHKILLTFTTLFHENVQLFGNCSPFVRWLSLWSNRWEISPTLVKRLFLVYLLCSQMHPLANVFNTSELHLKMWNSPIGKPVKVYLFFPV